MTEFGVVITFNVPTALLQGLNGHILTLIALSGPNADLEPSISAISPIVNVYGQLRCPEKAGRLTLASEGCGHT